ncbi:VOC family protein [Wenxinia saemankumensis]|uniref:Methylmalonyl-CoA/ethylmalonyl-CoA epimerase n=1 Tax=Wenxinia saemankumensis TaxID=1447782 RepID=A0A1M6D001_9RHOB|nr:VOC family protein [Wenxinia saemankumensis]SHI66433.1 methylmalonyl-CoA/ethylmalonyl-CoA epimerase [Wenxinia saemankumensis]
MRSDNPNVQGIKHMAFAVRDAEAALEAYSKYLHVPADTEITHFPKSGNKVALFYLGGIEYQLCQSTAEGGRFDAWIKERGAEGLHHICYAVDDIDAALAHAQAQGASLRECKACKKTGSHAHPEGWVAFLDNDAGGIEIEFMQVYTPEQLKAWEEGGAEAV